MARAASPSRRGLGGSHGYGVMSRLQQDTFQFSLGSDSSPLMSIASLMTQVSWSLSHVLELLVLEDWTLSSAEKALLVPNGPSPGHLRLPATSVDADSRGNLYMLGPVALLLLGFTPLLFLALVSIRRITTFSLPDC